MKYKYKVKSIISCKNKKIKHHITKCKTHQLKFYDFGLRYDVIFIYMIIHGLLV